MGQDEGQARPAVGNRDPDQLKEEIEETREDLGDTVAAVTEKVDVKKQATAKKDAFVAKAKEVTPDSAGASAEQARRFAQQNPVPIGLGAAFAAGLVAGWLVRGR
jgi:hypothetical protein